MWKLWLYHELPGEPEGKVRGHERRQCCLNYDFNALLAAHQASGADVTVAYQKTEIPEGRKNDNYTLTVDADGRVTELLFNDYRPGVQNLDLNIYVLERETLLKLVRDATSRGLIYFERDILAHNVNILNIHALEYTGYVAHVCDMKSYFDENLKLTDDENLEKLFPKKSPVYTKIRDDNPTRYVPGCKVTDSILADGCVIEGTVENCVLFRGVKVKKVPSSRTACSCRTPLWKPMPSWTALLPIRT